MTRDEALALARSTGWSSRLPPKLQADLLSVARLRVVTEGTWLYAVGGPPGGIFGIVSGCFAAASAQSSGGHQKSLLFHPGSWSGAGPVAGLPDRLAGFWATRDSQVLSIEIPDFRRVAAHHHDAWRQVALLVLENLGQTIGLTHALMVRGGSQRLRAILARLAGLHDELVPDPAIVDATQTDVADIANLSRSVVSQFLKEMEREGIIRLGWSSIEILSPQRLLESLEPSGG